ncbi:hypothetical protein J7T55_005070 [Diaporthe amygdali]|uniref:uncharacterized protein n=1 Tax=Phomopsis amygdali TaxID=1214568 RepID=UPI0022FE1EF7|nr:uncharacterized protein J7T55_005070 [Diaporthe amygdali]KAJ0116124.1 hypothetical protein J7T55_005070 [Diaporthe amygdali]
MAPKHTCVREVVPDESRRCYPPSHDHLVSVDARRDAPISSKEALRLFEVELAKLKQLGKTEQITNSITQSGQAQGQGNNHA